MSDLTLTVDTEKRTIIL